MNLLVVLLSKLKIRNNKVKFSFAIVSVFVLFKTGTLELNNGEYKTVCVYVFYV